MGGALQRLIFLSLTLWVLGCGGEQAGRTPVSPSWLTELPERQVTASPGETVWAVVPRAGSEAARVATYRLESAAGSAAVLVDAIGNRYEGVPGALVHAVSAFAQAELVAGSPVLADRWAASKVVGRVARVEDGEVFVAHDWNGRTTTGTMEVVMPLPVGTDPLADPALSWVSYPSGAARYKGLCFAYSAERVWISDDGGGVEVVPRDAIEILGGLGTTDLQVGAAVQAYSWGEGFQPGVIAAVLEPGLRYAVDLAGGGAAAYFFADLVVAGPPANRNQ